MGRELLGQADVEIFTLLQPRVHEHGLHELVRGHVQENLIVAGQGQPPGLGPQLGFVEDVTIHLMHLFKRCQDAVKREIPAAAELPRDAECRGIVQDVLHVHVFLLGNQKNLEFVEG